MTQARHDEACVKWNDRILFRVIVYRTSPSTFSWSVFSASRTEQALEFGSAPSGPAAWGAARAWVSSIVELLHDAFEDGATLKPGVSLKVPP